MPQLLGFCCDLQPVTFFTTLIVFDVVFGLINVPQNINIYNDPNTPQNLRTSYIINAILSAIGIVLAIWAYYMFSTQKSFRTTAFRTWNIFRYVACTIEAINIVIGAVIIASIPEGNIPSEIRSALYVGFFIAALAVALKFHWASQLSDMYNGSASEDYRDPGAHLIA